MTLQHKEIKKESPTKKGNTTQENSNTSTTGVIHKEPKRTTRENYITRINEYLEQRYEIRFNLLTLTPEIKGWDEDFFTPVDDRKLNTVWLEMQLDNLQCSDKVLEKILKSFFITSYDPLKEYFNTLPIYDGEDYIQQLADTIEISDIESNGVRLRSLWKPYLQKWLVASVANALEKGINQTCLILVSNQGKGKTTWLNKLCPSGMKDYLSSGHIVPSMTDKNTINLLAEKWFVNIDDQLQTIFKKDFNTLKSIITAPFVSNRKAWAKLAKTRPRVCSFMGSVDTPEFLTDNQNRRYLVFATDKVNYTHNVPMDKVWAQALHLFREDHSYWFSDSEILTLNKMNEYFRNASLEEEWLSKLFEPCKNTDPKVVFLMASEIHAHINARSGLRINNRKLLQALEKQFGRPFAKRVQGKSPRKVYAVRFLFNQEGGNIQEELRRSFKEDENRSTFQ